MKSAKNIPELPNKYYSLALLLALPINRKFLNHFEAHYLHLQHDSVNSDWKTLSASKSIITRNFSNNGAEEGTQKDN